MKNKEKFLLNLLKKKLNSKIIVMDSNLNLYSKWDSLQKIRIILEMEKKFKKNFHKVNLNI